MRKAVVLLTVLFAGLVFTSCVSSGPRQSAVSKWGKFEHAFRSTGNYENPFQTIDLVVTFTSPTGEKRTVPAFWDGGTTWKVRFSPNEMGKWQFESRCNDTSNLGLHQVRGSFVCLTAVGATPFKKHGPVQVSRDKRHLAHEDGTPFFFVGDTAWNGPLLSSDADWNIYIWERVRQRFNAVQWVTTQWRAAPNGDREGRKAYTGKDKISINPEFFQRLDEKVITMNQAGLLSVPVLLWANGGGAHPEVNPGISLPEGQATKLARYMVARWQADDVLWILPGDGDYRGPRADKWKRIGRGVFSDISHAPVSLHPGGMQWVMDAFDKETWVDINGYQSGHTDSDNNLRWIHSGPASSGWKTNEVRPSISLEAPYEYHYAGGTQQRMSDFVVRRAHWWSILNAPPAGITYGAHGVWGWDDGTTYPVDHPNTGVPLHWKEALDLPGAQQMRYLADFFNSTQWWRLRPAQQALAEQPGANDPKSFISCARSDAKDLFVSYIPAGGRAVFKSSELPSNVPAQWFNPRDGSRFNAQGTPGNGIIEFRAPGEGDWVLVFKPINSKL